MSQTLTADLLRPQVGARFDLEVLPDPIARPGEPQQPAPGSRFACELIEVRVSGAEAFKSGHVPPRLPFVATFRGPQEPRLPQRIYRLDHDGLGTLELFLVPVGRDAQGVRYEAIFT